jgi:glycosyltransferase involved in cell wall biosynthesis
VTRFLQINTFYPAYLGDFYDARPHLIDASYEVQIDALLDDGFSSSHIFTRPLRVHGFETMQVVANNGITQGAWQKEHGLWTGKTDSALTVLQQIEHFKPDIVYTTDVETLHSGFFRRLNKPPPVLAGWRGFPIPPQTDLSAYDLILTSFDRIFEEATARGAKHVARFHPGFPETTPVIEEPRQIEWDVLISGTVTHQHMKRVQIIDMIADMSRDPVAPFRLGLFMPNAGALSPVAQSMNRGARWGNDMLRLLRSARIVVNIDVDAFGAQPPNMRLIEATGAGTLLLTSYHPDLSNFFEPGEEIETFRTPQEMAAKLLYLLSHPERCDAMAARARERCLRDHGLTQRAAWFAGIMRDALSRAGREVRPTDL